MAEYKPGYVDVPGKGRRYRDEQGNYYHNHLGAPLNQLGNFFRGIGDAYQSYDKNARAWAERNKSQSPEERQSRQRPTQDSPKPPKAKPESSGSVVNMGGKTYNGLDDPEYIAAQKAELERQRQRGNGMSDIRGGDGLKPSGGGERLADPRSGRGSTRVSPTGVVQKGTDMSGANALLQRLGIDTVQYGQFESNKYPGSQDPTEKESKTDTDAKLTGQNVGAYVGSGASPTNQEELPTPDTNIVNTGAVAGGAASGSVELSTDSTNKGPALGSRRRAAQEFLADRPNMPAQYNESLVGLRASDASKGLLYASGKYWQEDGNGGFTEISKADYKTIKRGDQHAQQFAQDKIELVKALDTESDLVVDDSGSTVKDYGVSEADYPEATAYDPNEGEDFEKTSRMQNLVDRKEKGDFDKFIKNNNIAY